MSTEPTRPLLSRRATPHPRAEPPRVQTPTPPPSPEPSPRGPWAQMGTDAAFCDDSFEPGAPMATEARAPHGFGISFGFNRPLPISAPKAPPSYAVPPQGAQPVKTSRATAPTFPAGSGTGQVTRQTGMMDHDVLALAQQMEAQNYSFVSATPAPPFETAVLFERNPHTFQVLMGPDEAEWNTKTAQMAQAGWSYFGRHSQGSFNQVLTYFR